MCNNISLLLLLLLLLLKLPLLSQDICTLNADHLDGLFDLLALVPDGALSKGHPQEVECARAGIGVVGPHDQRELDAGRIGLLEQRVDGLGGARHDVALERGVLPHHVRDPLRVRGRRVGHREDHHRRGQTLPVGPAAVAAPALAVPVSAAARATATATARATAARTVAPAATATATATRAATAGTRARTGAGMGPGAAVAARAEGAGARGADAALVVRARAADGAAVVGDADAHVARADLRAVELAERARGRVLVRKLDEREALLDLDLLQAPVAPKDRAQRLLVHAVAVKAPDEQPVRHLLAARRRRRRVAAAVRRTRAAACVRAP